MAANGATAKKQRRRKKETGQEEQEKEEIEDATVERRAPRKNEWSARAIRPRAGSCREKLWRGDPLLLEKKARDG